MKFIIALILLLETFLVNSVIPKKIYNATEQVTEKWMTQKLNHFNPIDNRTWQMRYFEYDSSYKTGGPIFVLVGGEWNVDESIWILRGHAFDMVKKLNGIIFYTEHRFYGKSHPTPDTSTDNLKYLSVDQALEDLAYFIEKIKIEKPDLRNSGVIFVGRSYSASLVTWFRLKYPHLITGAWSSSGPIEAKFNFYEFREIVTKAIRTLGGQKCVDKIQKAFTEIEGLIAKNETRKIEESFNLCNRIDVSSKMNVMTLFIDLADAASNLAQYQQNLDIKEFCDLILDEKFEALEGYAAFFKRNQIGCLNHIYQDLISYYKNTNWNHGANQDSNDFKVYQRQWYYQTCSEFGWYLTVDSEKQIFGSSFSIDYFVKLCSDLFDGIFTKSIIEDNMKLTNLRYGGINPQITNVFSTQGELDPWTVVGLQLETNSKTPVIIIPLAAHAADFDSISENDPPRVRETKEKIFETIKKWLKLK